MPAPAHDLPLFDQAPDPQLLLDGTGTITRVNHAARAALGSRRDPVGTPAVLLIAPEHRRHWGATVAQVQRTTDVGVVQVQLMPPDWLDRTAELTVSLVHLPDATLLVTVRDVTTAHQHDERLQVLERLHRDHREALATLETALRPRTLPPLPLELGVAARVADRVAPFGGDLHDAQLLEDGTLHLSVVDGTGHGMPALRNALAIRDAARVLALDGCHIDVLAHHLDAVCRAQEPGLLGTAIVVRYDPRDGNTAVACLGHPPAIQARPDGSAATVGTPGPPVGVTAVRGPAEHTTLAVGDLLLLHTDGVSDPRAAADDPGGLDRLARDLRASSSGVLSPTATEVATTLLPDDTVDDALVLALRRTARPRPRRHDIVEGTRLRSHVRDPRPRDVTEMRHLVSDRLTELAEPPDHARRILLALSELATNAVAAGTAHLEVELEVLDDGTATLAVHDDGPGFDLEAALARVLTVGHGLRIVDAVTDDLRVAHGPQGTVVRARFERR